MSKNIQKFVKKTNDMVEARYKFDVWETRIFTQLISMIQVEDADFANYRLILSEILNKDERDDASVYEELLVGARRLMKKNFVFASTENGKQRLLEFPVLAHLDSELEPQNLNKAFIETSFHPKLKPYLRQLKDQYDAPNVQNLLKLPSNYSVRMYELLKKNAHLGSFQFEVPALRNWLGVADEYPFYANFKQRVLQKAQQDLAKHTDISFVFEEIKQARSIVSLVFSIQKNTNFDQNGEKSVTLPPFNPAFVEEIHPSVKQWVSRIIVENWVKNLPIEQIRRGVDYTLKQLANGVKIENVGGYLQRMVKTEKLTDVAEEKKQKADAQKQREHGREQEKTALQIELSKLQTQRAVNMQVIVNQLLTTEIDLKLRLVEETRIGNDADGDLTQLFDEFYNRSASFKGLVHNKLEDWFPQNFDELSFLDSKIQELKYKLLRY